MDAFYASVEQRDHPEWRNNPVIVGGSPDSRGVVCAASYEARAFGVRSAMPASKARRLCPHAVFVRPRFDAYVDASRAIRTIFRDYTDLVEPLSLDEAYLDVTTNTKRLPFATTIAVEIKDRIKKELSLTASAGVGPSKFIAKLASDLRKPDGLVVVKPHQVTKFLEPLPVERLWGVGPATAGKIRALGVSTIGEVAQLSAAHLERVIGSMGPFIHKLATGDDPRPVVSERVPRSRGAERTFPADIVEIDKLMAVCEQLVHEVAESLKECARPGRTVTLKVRYDDFSTISRSYTFLQHTWDENVLFDVTAALLDKTDAKKRPVRLIGVSVSNLLQDHFPLQLEFPFVGNLP
ncbi:MAG: DNA polymerase IV [Myxococcales bacterium]|nr:DNA polymerase IV [Myxococcales bacterium]